MKTIDSINNLDEAKQVAFAKLFLNFYLENGFGNKTKNDLDCEIYDILCQIGAISDNKSAILLGQELKTTATAINKYREYRFYQSKISEKRLKADILDVFKHNLDSVSRDKKMVFTIHNVATKLYLEKYLQTQNQNYDYSFNSNNIKLSAETFRPLYEWAGGNPAEVDKKIIKKIQQELNEHPNLSETEQKKYTTIIQLAPDNGWKWKKA